MADEHGAAGSAPATDGPATGAAGGAAGRAREAAVQAARGAADRAARGAADGAAERTDDSPAARDPHAENEGLGPTAAHGPSAAEPDAAEEHGADHWRGIRERKQEMLNVRREIAQRRSPAAKAVEWIGNFLADPRFFVTFLLAHVGWIVLNLGIVPGVAPWDPPPFMLLATLTSAEAPIIALLILMAQSRARRINELREEVGLQVDLYMERQTTAVLRMLEAIQDEMGIEQERGERFEMLAEPIDPKQVMAEVEDDLEDDEDLGRPPEK
jgi:uncharacterized membrane protein